MGRLFTIGDSISQGFRSGGTAFTEHAYSTYLAQALQVPQYRILQWPAIKLKIDIEGLLRTLEARFGPDISAIEWLMLLATITDFQDKSEEYYERGDGSPERPVSSYQFDFTDNCAVEGMRVADAWEVTPRLCLTKLQADADSNRNNKGIAMASSPFYRAACKVLNPLSKPEFLDYSPIKWLEHVATTEGVENTIVFLGANNALGTIFDLALNPGDVTPGEGRTFGSRAGNGDENKYSLWHPRAFDHDYRLLISKVKEAMSDNIHSEWRVYLGTVPLVTIAAMIEGFGEERLVDDPREPLGTAKKQFRYYQYYKYYGVEESTALRSGKTMKFRDALFIDKVIIEFNNSIRRIAEEMNSAIGREAFVVVDISNALTDMAWKRNSGMPSYKYPDELQWLFPPINTKFYSVSPQGEIADGGIFSLDGIHPTVIGQGVIAWEFLKAMIANNSAPPDAALNWAQIIADDKLRQDPLAIVSSVVDKWQAIDFIMNALSVFGKV